MTDEVKEFRSILREKMYLVSPASNKMLTSISGEVLDQELANFLKLAREQRARYILRLT